MNLLLVIFFTIVVNEPQKELLVNQSDKFYDKILSDYHRKSYFIACDIISPDYTGKVIVENDDLFYYFRINKGFSKKKYRKYMVRRLLNNQAVEIETSDLTHWNFIPIDTIEAVKQSASGGSDYFVRHYFDGNVIKQNIKIKERNAIIDELFHWKIGSKIDDESGYLYIPVHLSME